MERDAFKEEMEQQGYNRKRYINNKQLQKAEDELSQLRHDFENQVKADAKRMKEFQKESNEIIFSQDNKIKQLEKEATRRGHTIKELSERLNKTGWTERKPDISKHELLEEISKMKEVLQHTLTKLHDTEYELAETKTR